MNPGFGRKIRFTFPIMQILRYKSLGKLFQKCTAQDRAGGEADFCEAKVLDQLAGFGIASRELDFYYFYKENEGKKWV